MQDMYSKQVNNGDILVESHDGESCFIFRVENERPILKARWGIWGSLDKHNEKIIMERIEQVNIQIKRGILPRFMENYYETMLERIQNIKSENLMLIEGANSRIYSKFVEEEHESIPYGMSFKDAIGPIAEFPDQRIVGEW